MAPRTILPRLGLQARLTALTTLGLAAVFVVMGYIGLRNQAVSLDVVLEQRVALAQTFAAHIDDHVGDMLTELAAAAEYPGFDLSDDDLEHEQHALADLYRQGTFYDVFVADARGIVLAVEPESLRAQLVGADFSQHAHVRRALETGEPQVSGVIPRVAAPSPLVSLVVPVKNAKGESVGLIGGALDPSGPAIAGFVAPLAPGKSGYAQVIDGQGMVIASTIPDRIGKTDPHSELTLSLLQRGQPAVSPDSLVTEEGKEFHEVIAFAPIPRFGWGVTVEQDRAEALAPIIQARNQIQVAATIVLVVAIFFIWLTTRQVTRPLLMLAAAARRLGEGDLSTAVAAGGSGEVAELGRSFEAMRQKLAAWGEELEAAVQKRTRELFALYSIDRAAAQSLDLEEILNDALDKALEVLEVEAGGILLLEPDGEMLRLHVHRGASAEFVENIRRMRLDEGVSGQAVAEGRPVVVALEDYPTKRLAAIMAREGFQTIASTPLVAGGRALGALTLAARRRRAFPPEEIALLEAIGSQLGTAVANAQLHASVADALAREQRLDEVAHTISASLDLDVILPRVVRLTAELVGVEAGAMALVEADGQTIAYPYLHNLPESLSMQPSPKGRGLAWQIVETGEPALLPNYGAHPQALPQWVEAGVRSFIGVPLTVGDTTIGALGLFSLHAGRHFSEQDVALASAIARQAAVAIQNARLYEAEQRRAARLAAIAQLGIQLATAHDEDALLQMVVTGAAALADSPACTVMLVDPASDEAVLAAQFGLPKGTPPGLRVPLSLPVIRRSLKTGDPIILPDIDRDAPEMRTILIRPDIRAFFAYPMMREGLVVGFLTLSSLTQHSPSTQEVAAYRLLADRAAAALQNARLYTQARRLADERSLIAEVALASAAGLPWDAVIERATQALARLWHTGYAGFLFPDETGHLRPHASYRGFTKKTLRTLNIPPGRGITGYVMQTGQPVRVDDVRQDARYIAGRADVRSEICAPLKVGERVLGVVNVESAQQEAFDEDDLRLLSALADQMAILLENNRLHQQLQTSEREYRTLFEESPDAIFILDMEGKHKEANARAAQLLGYTREEMRSLSVSELSAQLSESMLVLERLASGESIPPYERLFRKKNGEMLPVEIHLALIHDDRGNPSRIQSIVRDITERKRAEEQIRTQLEQLKALRAVDMAISASTDLRLTLQAVLKQVEAQLKADACAVLLLKPHLHVLEFVAGLGFRTREIERSSVHLGEGAAGRAALQRQTVVLHDLVHGGQDFVRTDLVAAEGFVCYYGVPLIAKGEVKGILELFFRQHVEHNEEWEGFLEALAGQAAIAIDNSSLFENLQRVNAELGLAYETTLEGWSAALDLRDKETEGHTQRVTEMTLDLARAMGMTDSELMHIRRGGLLHDIGKMGIPDYILLKPGKLSKDEWAQMRQHPVLAYDMLSPIAYLRPALDIPYCHHEKWDGTGYPRGLKGTQIPLAARIFAVVDVWDALTSDRPYRKAWSQEKALAYIKEQSGKHFDPQVVEAFLAHLGRL